MAMRPNIIMIVGEDTGCHLGCYDAPAAITPNLDRLADEGTRFTNFYSVAPVCAPARSALVTGRYPQKVGSHHMRSTVLQPPALFTQRLRQAGYHVNWSNKTDFNFDPDVACPSLGPWRDDASDWLEPLAQGRMPRQPWFAYVNLSVTHESMMWPDKFAQENPSAAGAEMPDAQKPEHVMVPPYLPDVQAVREDISRHARNVTLLDEQVGRILDALDASGAREDTLVIFLADHGRGLPREKRWAYTAGIHVPLILRWPGRIEAGRTDIRMMSGVDFAPTLLSLAGVDAPDDGDGQAMLQRDDARGSAEPVNDNLFIFAGRDRMDEAFDRVRIVRNHRYHYVRNFFPSLPWAQRIRFMETIATMQALRNMHAAGHLEGDAAVFMAATKPAEELYDIQADPHCMHNLADDEAHAQAKAGLAEALDDWIERIGDLGAIPERDLIARGIVRNRLDDEYRLRTGSLLPEHRIGPERTVLEMHEAQAYWPDESESL